MREKKFNYVILVIGIIFSAIAVIYNAKEMFSVAPKHHVKTPKDD